jgi:hypothetical protein
LRSAGACQQQVQGEYGDGYRQQQGPDGLDADARC